jgi:hypothetical protein
MSAPLPLGPELILFEHENFRGAHKHLFANELNLNAPDDNFFNDRASSVAVLQESWLLFRDANARLQYPVALGRGLFPSLRDLGLPDNDLSSLLVAGLVLTFQGTMTAQTNIGGTSPTTLPLSFTMNFSASDRALNILSFPPLNLMGVGQLFFEGADAGVFRPDGSVEIPGASFVVDPALAGIANFTVKTTITTGRSRSPGGNFDATGSPANADGGLVLVAAGPLQFGFEFLVTLRGTITPRP